MQQVICPVLEFLQTTGESDAPDGAVAGTEADEVRGGLRPELSAGAVPGGGGGDSISERTGRRWRERTEAECAEGPCDRRLGRVSARRAGVDEVMAVGEPFDTRYRDFTPKHFRENAAAGDTASPVNRPPRRLALQPCGPAARARPREAGHGATSGCSYWPCSELPTNIPIEVGSTSVGEAAGTCRICFALRSASQSSMSSLA